jgi:hypothetical protein
MNEKGETDLTADRRPLYLTFCAHPKEWPCSGVHTPWPRNRVTVLGALDRLRRPRTRTNDLRRLVHAIASVRLSAKRIIFKIPDPSGRVEGLEPSFLKPLSQFLLRRDVKDFSGGTGCAKAF